MTDSTSRAQLLPCPFCGHAPEIHRVGDDAWLGCMNHSCSVAPYVETTELSDRGCEASAVEAWNRRAAAKHSIPSQSAQAEAVALLTVAHKDDPIWRGMNFIGPTAFGKTLPAGKYELYAHPSAREAAPEFDSMNVINGAHILASDMPATVIRKLRESLDAARAALGEGK